MKRRPAGLAALLRGLSRTGGVNPARHQNQAIRRPLEKYDEAASGKSIVPTDRACAVKDLMAACAPPPRVTFSRQKQGCASIFFCRELTDEQQATRGHGNW
ncbi:MAG: hypothetical protein ABI318_21670 [Chthoniobacteraceae bacterium]